MRSGIHKAVLAGLAASIVALPLPAAAIEQLVMPYSCMVSGAIVKLTPDIEKTYRVFGPRQESTITACLPNSSAGCQPMIAHRFSIKCDGKKVGWDMVAAAARRIGAPMPRNLPEGFAPVSPMGARIVFPAESKRSSQPDDIAVTELAAHDVEGMGDASLVQPAAWVTVVRAGEMAGVRVTEGAAKFAVVLAVVLGIMLAVTVVISAGMRPAPFRLGRLNGRADRRLAFKEFVASLPEHMWSIFAAARQYANDWASRASHDLFEDAKLSKASGRRPKFGFERTSGKEAQGPSADGVAMLLAMLERTETIVADKVMTAVLRGVLQGELHRVHQRLVSLETADPPVPAERAAASLRAMASELDRIRRIAEGAAESARERVDIPRSRSEAYEVLGVNNDVAPGVAKKVVDALRASWHPDHARDEDDRQRREERIKQINAAWDLINERRAAA